ncbi:hypothetical protein [Modestobacter sp. VKM Ac-2984]|uniref:hypothetical protein n=1 Tax=Modestobacter sp. VKM Ac-2984 TaxID=3004138 RepID=UPI0022AA1A6E|nr:hypothetical protein [Modestobacter sp. VKM Ac-2984]MCZ2817971.1 hypothetical protein [Modestobacter sp. VKM Ac-2984]
MSKRTVVAGVAWVVLTVLAFGTDVILGSVVLIFGAAAVVVVQLSSTWSQHPDFETRELARARRRKAKWEKNAPRREKDTARYAAHQARQAAKARAAEDRTTGASTADDRTAS